MNYSQAKETMFVLFAWLLSIDKKELVRLTGKDTNSTFFLPAAVAEVEKMFFNSWNGEVTDKSSSDKAQGHVIFGHLQKVEFLGTVRMNHLLTSGRPVEESDTAEMGRISELQIWLRSKKSEVNEHFDLKRQLDSMCFMT